MTTSGGIPFENNLEIEALARFTIDEYNRRQNALVLEFMKVLDARRQVLEKGFMYYLTLEVLNRNENKNKVGEAMVWLKPDNSKVLLDFNLVRDA